MVLTMLYHPDQGDALIDVVEEMDQVDKRLDDAFQAEERFYVFLEMLVVLVRGCFLCCVPQATVRVSRHDTRCCGAPHNTFRLPRLVSVAVQLLRVASRSSCIGVRRSLERMVTLQPTSASRCVYA